MPDIIGYSVCSNEIKQYLEINLFLKKELNFFSIFGGPHPTFFPSMIEQEGVDAICRGEGDVCFPEFLKHFGTDKMYEVSNFSFKYDGKDYKENPITDLLEDLDSVPFPDRELIYSESYFLTKIPIKAFFTGRGCPYNCSYCFNHAYNSMYKAKGKVIRIKSVSYLLEEIKDIGRKYPLTFVKFHDDIFGAVKPWLSEFADRYPKEVGLPFNCYVRPNMATEEYCRLLKRAGCYSVCMAIESGNEKLRNLVLGRNVSNEQILFACENLKKFDLQIMALNMVGLPGETENEIFETIKINQRTGINYADASIFQPYPGTRIAEYCKKNGYLSNDVERYESMFTVSILNFEPDFKYKVYVLHKLFAIIVDYPRLKSILGLVYKLRWSSLILGFIYKLYYGFCIHKRIFASAIPFMTRMYGAILVIIAKDRGA